MRLLFFLVLLGVGVIGPWYVLFVGALIYAFRYTAYELVVVGMLLDVSYGIGFWYIPFPCLYTLSVVAMVAVFETLRPLLAVSKRA